MSLSAFAGRYAMDDNHPEWRWRTLSTQRARIHFPVSKNVSGRWTASRVAEEVDPLWEKLCDEVGVRPRLVHIVVVEDTDQLEGFTLPSNDWVVFSGHPGPELTRMRGRVDWVPDLLAHELAHVAVHRASRVLPNLVSGLGIEVGGVFEADGVQLGGGLDLVDDAPYWFREGSAEFWSEQVGVNTWTSARDLTLTASVLDDRLLPLDRWGSSNLLDDWYDGERAYQEGYAFLRWLRDTNGVESLRTVVQEASRRPRLRWESVFEDVYGSSLTLLVARFRADLRATVRARVDRVERAGRVEGRELARWSLGWDADTLRGRDRWELKDPRERLERRESTGTLNLHAQWSSDGRWFGRQRSGWLEVREVAPSLHTVFAGKTPDWSRTRGQRRLARRHSAWWPASYGTSFGFVPGANALVMVDEIGHDQVHRARTEHNELLWVDLEPKGAEGSTTLDDGWWGRRRRRHALPGTRRGFDPVVSPDGSTLAFVKYDDGGTQLFVMELPDGVPQQLTQHADGEWVESPSFAPDGQTLVASRHHRTGQDLWVYDLTGGAEPLATTPFEEVDPMWALDGSIWFSADVGGIYDIFRYDGRFQRMTQVVTAAQSPSLTPDGALIYSHFTSFGWKSYGLPASELLWHDVTDQFGDVGTHEAERVVLQEGRPYSAWRSVLKPSLSPLLRLDLDSSGRPWPRVGGFFRARDAVEHHTLTLSGWAGRDASIRGRYTWHTLWPEVWVAGAVDRTQLAWEGRARTLAQWEVGVEVPLRGDTSLRAQAGRWEAVGGNLAQPHRSRVLSASLGFGDAWRLKRRPEATGAAGRLYSTIGWSNGEAPYGRLEWSATRVVRAPVAGGAGHRLVVGMEGGWTHRHVALEDRLRIGGDHPYALRPGLYQATSTLPGYDPYALDGRWFTTVGLRWRAPLGVRLGQAFAGGVVDRVGLELGGHAGLLDSAFIGDVVGRVRVSSVVLGRPVGSGVTFAWGAPTPSDTGGWRTAVSIGSGF